MPAIKKMSTSATNVADFSQFLNGYTECKGRDIEKLRPGDKIRYMSQGFFRKGGSIRNNSFPKYMVLINDVSKASWCIQLTDPTLKIWVKSVEQNANEMREMHEVYRLFKEGKLKKTTR